MNTYLYSANMFADSEQQLSSLLGNMTTESRIVAATVRRFVKNYIEIALMNGRLLTLLQIDNLHSRLGLNNAVFDWNEKRTHNSRGNYSPAFPVRFPRSRHSLALDV